MQVQTRGQGALETCRRMDQQRRIRLRGFQAYNRVAIPHAFQRRRWRGRTAANHCRIWTPWPRRWDGRWRLTILTSQGGERPAVEA
jgi:hypothetical protein